MSKETDRLKFLEVIAQEKRNTMTQTYQVTMRLMLYVKLSHGYEFMLVLWLEIIEPAKV